MARKIPFAVVLLAAGHKARREGKDHETATREMIDTLPAMGYEVDHSARKSGKNPLETPQPFEPLSVE